MIKPYINKDGQIVLIEAEQERIVNTISINEAINLRNDLTSVTTEDNRICELILGRYKSRKFIAAIVVITLSSLFLYLGKIDSSQWMMAVNISLGLYISGNIGQKKINGE